MAEKNCTNKQTNKQTDRHYENNGHLAVNQNVYIIIIRRRRTYYVRGCGLLLPTK